MYLCRKSQAQSPRTQVKVGCNSIVCDPSVSMLRWEENPLEPHGSASLVYKEVSSKGHLRQGRRWGLTDPYMCAICMYTHIHTHEWTQPHTQLEEVYILSHGTKTFGGSERRSNTIKCIKSWCPVFRACRSSSRWQCPLSRVGTSSRLGLLCCLYLNSKGHAYDATCGVSTPDTMELRQLYLALLPIQEHSQSNLHVFPAWWSRCRFLSLRQCRGYIRVLLRSQPANRNFSTYSALSIRH